MKEKRPGKIDLDSPSAPLQAGLSAFGALDALAGLPPAPETPASPAPPAAAPALKAKGVRLLLRREKKDRGGKTVVVVSGCPAAEADGLARLLRKGLGCGGSVDDGEIVVQGDRPAEVAAFLRDLGFAVGGVTG